MDLSNVATKEILICLYLISSNNGVRVNTAEEHHMHILLSLEHALHDHLSGRTEPSGPPGSFEHHPHHRSGEAQVGSVDI